MPFIGSDMDIFISSVAVADHTERGSGVGVEVMIGGNQCQARQQLTADGGNVNPCDILRMTERVGGIRVGLVFLQQIESVGVLVGFGGGKTGRDYELLLPLVRDAVDIEVGLVGQPGGRRRIFIQDDLDLLLVRLVAACEFLKFLQRKFPGDGVLVGVFRLNGVLRSFDDVQQILRPHGNRRRQAQRKAEQNGNRNASDVFHIVSPDRELFSPVRRADIRRNASRIYYTAKTRKRKERKGYFIKKFYKKKETARAVRTRCARFRMPPT